MAKLKPGRVGISDSQEARFVEVEKVLYSRMGRSSSVMRDVGDHARSLLLQCDREFLTAPIIAPSVFSSRSDISELLDGSQA